MLDNSRSRKRASIAAVLALVASVSVTTDQSIARQAAKTLPRPQKMISSFAILKLPAIENGGEARRNVVGPAQFFTINAVISKNLREPGPSAVRFTTQGDALTETDERKPVLRGTEPFGLFALRAPEGILWDKWREVSQAIEADTASIKACQIDSESCSLEAVRFQKLIDEARAATGRIQLDVVNTQLNDIIRYKDDMAQHGMSDRWSAPLTTLASGYGDCEDYAIAKYVALREAGIAPADLRIVLVQDTVVNQAHAVLAVKEEERWLLLDNRWSRILESDDARRFAPRFAIDHNGVKLFAMPYASNSAF